MDGFQTVGRPVGGCCGWRGGGREGDEEGGEGKAVGLVRGWWCRRGEVGRRDWLPDLA